MISNFSKLFVSLSAVVFISCGQPKSHSSDESSQLIKPYSPFFKYDFENKEYVVLGIFWGGGKDEQGISETFGQFYIDDVEVLNDLKADWQFNQQGSSHACGYQYDICVTKNKTSVESMLINFDCSDIATTEGHYYFDEKRFDVLKNRVKTLYVDEKKFDNIDTARAYLEKIKNSENLLLIYKDEPAWINFEGNFAIIYTDKNEPADEEILKNFNSYITSNHPGEKYALDITGYASGGDYFITMKCNKTLFDSFDFNEYKAFGTWTDEYLSLTSYWKTNPNK